MDNGTEPNQFGRRAFIKNGVLVLAAASVPSATVLGDQPASSVKVGLVTDLHYADKKTAGSRHYRETRTKLEEAAQHFQQAQLSFLVELGDFIDAADSVDVEQKYLQTINKDFSAICEDRHYVLGNHCVDTLKKEEFLDGVEQQKSYYSFDKGGIHFVVLDSCFRSDGQPYGRKNSKWHDANIPMEQLEWLQADLKQNQKPTVVFAHQRLDVSTAHGVKNNADVRTILESSGLVTAVFQGHSHKNDLKIINQIHYCTLVAMVEGSGITNNGYSVLDISPDGTIHLTGVRNQASHDWNLPR